MINYIEAINKGHNDGLKGNSNSYIIGLGVNYDNGADGTTKGLSALYPDKILDVPVSESAVTGMCVGMATMGLNPIVHHGRVEFALYAMDQILTQAAKWNYMFGGEYPCRFSARLNIGRQWGNGPQHTSSYNSLFANTPGLNIFWPSRPKEAYNFIRILHHVRSPAVHMEHRWLFKTTDNISESVEIGQVQTAAIYGEHTHADILIVTYGDGLIEALKTKEKAADKSISIICFTAFIKNRVLDKKLVDLICTARRVIFVDTSNYEYGILQSILGSVSGRNKINGIVKVFSPPFLPVATAAQLVKEYYPTSPEIVKYLFEEGEVNSMSGEYSFDEINLPPEFDFSNHKASYIINEELF